MVIAQTDPLPASDTASFTLRYSPSCRAHLATRRSVMVPIRGLYEVAIPVKHLPPAEAFYRDVLGLEIGLRDERRNWLFLHAGGAGNGVLQEHPGDFPTYHFAFAVDEAGLERAAGVLR